MAPHNPNALAEAQSASEMFDVMCPPIAGFDIYNDRAVPTGESKARGTVHAQKQWHRSVHVWLVDAERGLVALQKRSPNKDTFPNRWDISAAGHIESGDESRPTAVRELAEELGVICVGDDLEFHGVRPGGTGGSGRMQLLRGRVSPTVRLEDDGVRGGRGGGHRRRLDAHTHAGVETKNRRPERRAEDAGVPNGVLPEASRRIQLRGVARTINR